jgi:hypothetical protein
MTVAVGPGPAIVQAIEDTQMVCPFFSPSGWPGGVYQTPVPVFNGGYYYPF